MTSRDSVGAEAPTLVPVAREAGHESRDLGGVRASLAFTCAAGAVAVASGWYALNRHFDADAIADAVTSSRRCSSAQVVEASDPQVAQLDAASVQATVNQLNSRDLYVSKLVTMQCAGGDAEPFRALLVAEIASDVPTDTSVGSQPLIDPLAQPVDEPRIPRTIALAVDATDIATLTTALNGSTEMPWYARLAETPRRSAYRTQDTLEAVSEVVDAALANDGAVPVGSNPAVLDFAEPYRVAIDAVQSERSNRWKRSVAQAVTLFAGLGAAVGFSIWREDSGYLARGRRRGVRD